MTWRQIGWTVCLAGLPLAPLALGPLTHHKIDLWHAHAWWMWLGVAVLLAGSLADGTTRCVPNPPLAWYAGWVAGWFLLSFLIALTTAGGYNLPLLMAMLHVAIAVIVYHALVQVPSQVLERVLPWLARVAVLLSGYGLLQHLGFEQFFRSTISSGDHGDQFLKNRRVIGTIGNPSHFAAYLSCAWPLVLSRVGKIWWIGRVIVLWALVLTHAWGGALAVLLVSLWWYRTRPGMLLLLLGGSVTVLTMVAIANPQFFSLSGRWLRWVLLVEMFQGTLITGAGPGAMLALSQGITDTANPLYHWRHAHNEYLQVAIEHGLVALGLLGWMVVDWAKKAWAMRSDRLVQVYTAVFLAFLCNSLYNFPAHLWVIGSLGLLGYAGVYGRAAERMG